MKKIIIASTIFAVATISNAAGFQPQTYNWNGGGSMSKTMAPAKKMAATTMVQNTSVAHRLNRNNSASIADIEAIATGSYDAKLAMAKAEKEKAQAAGFEWNTIRKLLKAAAKDHKAGNDKAAMSKLDTAIEHGRLGQQQAMDQKNAGPRF